jgi:hypothetical protein
MRILDIIIEGESPKIYSIGDSHAVAVATTGKFVNLATNGRSSIAGENDAAINQVPAGSTVVLSAGANDMTNTNKQQIVKRVNSLISKLQQKKCKVFYILFAETDSPKYAKDRNQLRQLVQSSLPSDVEVIDMGKLSVATGDGIHAPMSWYAKASRQVRAGATPAPAAQNIDNAQKVAPPVSGMKPGEDRMAHAGAMQQLTVPPDNVNPQVADVQKILLALGYKLPKHGVDGVRGPETRNALKQFQKDNGLKVDGAPGQGTIDKLNELIAIKNLNFTKSTEADVKKEKVTAFTGPGKTTPLQMDAVTKGKVGGILDFIAQYESRGFYDIMNGSKRFPEILKMTLKDLIKFQNNHHKTTGNSTAAGRYQIMEFNIIPYARSAGLDLNKDVFNEENQDKMAIVFLREKGLEKWLAGTMSDKAFLEGLSRVWAAIPSVSKGGLSYYDKVGNNKAGMPLNVALNNLQTIKQA